MTITLCNCQEHSDHDNCRPECNHDITTQTSTGNATHVTGSYIEGRNLSRFDQDILKILCAVLMHTGPVSITDKDIEELDINELVVEKMSVSSGYIVSYGEVHGVN